MFTDAPVTPARVEVLVDLFRKMEIGKLTRVGVYELVQPKALPDVGSGREQAKATVRACIELGLLDADGVNLRSAISGDDPRSTRRIVLDAIDERVLSRIDIEPYFALFYSYVLGLGAAANAPRKKDEWVNGFSGKRAESNPFNPTKLDGLHRWMRYAGLGWYDPSGEFQANPCGRLERRLPRIFGGKSRVFGEEFMHELSVACPELDGGSIFVQANQRYDRARRECTLGLGHALVELHSNGVIRLHCAEDSRGWSIAEAEPERDGKTLRADRIDIVEYTGQG